MIKDCKEQPKPNPMCYACGEMRHITRFFFHGKWAKGVLRQKMLRCWLRKQTDINCINVAELEAVMKSINLDLKCELKENEIKQVCDHDGEVCANQRRGKNTCKEISCHFERVDIRV